MTKSRFKAAQNLRAPCVAALALVLFGCATSAGEPAAGFINPAIQAAYLPLSGSAYLVMEGHGAAVVIAPGIAVTNAHNAELIDAKDVIGNADGYDLLYFRVNRNATVPTAAPVAGEGVIAYGNPNGDLHQSRGIVQEFWPAAFGYASNAGPGFSGGPVVDARTGTLVGITYGFEDHPGGGRLMVAYNMPFVMSELAIVRAKAQERPRDGQKPGSK